MRGEKEEQGPGPSKKRANSKKGIKIEHVSEATAGQWGLSGLRGGRVDPGTQTGDLGWRQHGATVPAPSVLFLPVPPTQ